LERFRPNSIRWISGQSFRFFGRYHQGLIAALRGDLDAADEAFQNAIKELRAPTGRMANAYGAVLRLKGDDEGAKALYDAAIGVSVGDAMLEAEIAALAAGEKPDLLINTPQEGAAEALFGLASALGQGQESETRLSLFYARLAQHLHPKASRCRLAIRRALLKVGNNMGLR